MPKEGEIVLMSNKGGDNPRDWKLMYFCKYQFASDGFTEGYVGCPEESWETYGNYIVFSHCKSVENIAVQQYISMIVTKLHDLQEKVNDSVTILHGIQNGD